MKWGKIVLSTNDAGANLWEIWTLTLTPCLMQNSTSGESELNMKSKTIKLLE